MSTITKKQFLDDVMHEIDMLKKHATAKEISKLNFEYLSPSSQSRCIYGQMTGSCKSERAHMLMNLACVREFDSNIENIAYRDFRTIKHYINGGYTGRTWIASGNRTFNYCSALEGYITLKGAKNKQIIAYLKDEIKTLKL